MHHIRMVVEGIRYFISIVMQRIRNGKCAMEKDKEGFHENILR